MSSIRDLTQLLLLFRQRSCSNHAALAGPETNLDSTVKPRRE